MPAVSLTSAASAPASSIAGAVVSGWFEAGSLSFELAKGLPAVVVTLVIGGLAAYIAWQQYQVAVEQRRVAHAKLNLDLFQRRYEIFESTWIMLSAMIHGTPNLNEVESTFNNARPRARFLFGVGVEQYMTDLTTRILETKEIRKALEQSGPPGSAEQNARLIASQSFFQHEAGVGIRDMFGRYLDFSEWR